MRFAAETAHNHAEDLQNVPRPEPTLFIGVHGPNGNLNNTLTTRRQQQKQVIRVSETGPKIREGYVLGRGGCECRVAAL